MRMASVANMLIAVRPSSSRIGPYMLRQAQHERGYKDEQLNTLSSSPSNAHFPQFGLSIVKTNNWHITLRHHAYNALQPTGHFHNDIGSITLAVNGIPVIIDPGSFVYTPSAMWRNYFRSVACII